VTIDIEILGMKAKADPRGEIAAGDAHHPETDITPRVEKSRAGGHEVVVYHLASIVRGNIAMKMLETKGMKEIEERADEAMSTNRALRKVDPLETIKSPPRGAMLKSA
jgi:hypothetical protein